MNTQETFFVLSAERSDLPADENARLTSELQGSLERSGVRYKPVFGTWEGRSERSFLVVGNEAREIVLGLAADFHQDAVLEVTPGRLALLEDIHSGETRSLGNWECAGDKQPTGDHTFDPDSKLYYQVTS